MIRGLNTWQTSLADLSLILFLVVATAHREDAGEGQDNARTQEERAIDIAQGQPMAVFRPGGDADLARWLKLQGIGEGEVATVIVRHAPGAAAQAAAQAAQLAGQIEEAGHFARLMVEPGASPETLVVIAHDRQDVAGISDGTIIADTRAD
ncbi:hypothetical protein [Alteriqipengyuania lutimaris]|nr:hypothetical protein [Alteriqipengyuania lutimaris]MBB3033974.1 hypothetical protein [Alteriqipengyuania lutimaris]